MKNKIVVDKEIQTDLLNREEFIEQIIQIISLFSQKSKPSCFAINGNWGVGKSFVLKKLEDRLEEIQSEETQSNKYLLFHYNCWEYDYYDEPLVAIVASMLDTIDKKENLIPANIKTKIKGFLKAIGNGLLLKTNQIIEEKTGIDPKEIIETVKNANENTAEQIEKNQAYDSNFLFKSTLESLKKILYNLSQDKTIIFVVDELDRCLPEYTIKVLERLHHIFDNISNIQVVLSIDKEQLTYTIKQIYGEKTDVDKYLAKFIDFEVKLNEGNLNDKFEEEFEYYLGKFELLNSATQITDVKDFQKKIFSGIDMRSRIDIINKCYLLHEFLCKEEKTDFSVMCIELFFGVVKHWKVDIGKSMNNFQIDNQYVYEKANNVYSGLDYMITMYKKQEREGLRLYYTETSTYNVRRDNIWGVVLSSYRYILGFTRDVIHNDYYKKHDLLNYSNKFWNLLQIIG